MKWISLGLLTAFLLAQTVNTTQPVSDFVPAGALIYLESKNFNALLGDWNASAEKAAWAKSANFQVFSRSMLYGRLERVFTEYATGVGVRPDLDLLSSVAGSETALAVYDVNKIEFLYLTKLPSARATESLLWKARDKFGTRSAAGTAYYLKTEPQSKRTACFAISGDWLLISTKEDALAGALSLLARGTARPIRQEPWFDSAIRAAGQPGELRMLMSLPRLAATPAFRSHWVQRNGPELRQYTAAIADLHRSATEYREERVMLRAEAKAAPDSSAVAGLAALAPANAGLLRVWAQPDVSTVTSLIKQKIAYPGQTTFIASKFAPAVSIEAAGPGSEADLESRIDDAPFEQAGAIYRWESMRDLLAANPLRAALHVQSSRTLSDGVFVGNDSAVVIEGANDWNLDAVRNALQRAVEGLYTTQNIGLNWTTRNGVSTTSGLARLAVAVRGKRLLLATRPELLDEILASSGSSTINASYAATYNPAGESAHYRHVTGMIERSDPNTAQSAEPRFFSDNLAGLVDTLKRVQVVEVREQDSGASVKQTVTYRLGR